MRDLSVAAALAAGLCAILAATSSDYGITWDERLYLESGTSFMTWLRSPSFSSIDEHWSPYYTHPPFHQALGGATRYVLYERLGWLDELGAFRASTLLFAFALLSGLYLFAQRLYGRGIAVAVVLSFFLMPRVFYHAHLGALDYSITALIFWTSFAYWRSLERPRWIWVAAFVLGLGLATKLNAYVIYPTLGLAYVLHHGRDALTWRRLRGQIPLIVVPPLVVFAMWPWLWPDPLVRAENFVGYHLDHFAIPVFYLGAIWDEAPFHYPFVTMLVTVPAVTLFVAAAGALGLVSGPRRKVTLFFAASALLPLVVVALPGVPKYDGVRLFLPAFPFLCLLSGEGLAQLASRVRMRVAARVVWGGYLIALLLTVGPVLRLVHPYEISYFNLLAGGYRGAVAHGFDADYWGGSYAALLQWMKEEGESAYWMPIATRLGIHYLETGALPPSVRFADRAESDYLVLLMRPGFFDLEQWRHFREREPVIRVGPPGRQTAAIYRLAPSATLAPSQGRVPGPFRPRRKGERGGRNQQQRRGGAREARSATAQGSAGEHAHRNTAEIGVARRQRSAG